MKYGDQQLLVVGNKTFGCKSEIKSVSSNLLPKKSGDFFMNIGKKQNKHRAIFFFFELMLNCYAIATTVLFFRFFAPVLHCAARCQSADNAEKKWKWQRERNPSQHVTLQILLSRAWPLIQGASVSRGSRQFSFDTVKLLSFKVMKWVNAKKFNCMRRALQNDWSGGVKRTQEEENRSTFYSKWWMQSA